jgi:hypothetical protein
MWLFSRSLCSGRLLIIADEVQTVALYTVMWGVKGAYVLFVTELRHTRDWTHVINYLLKNIWAGHVARMGRRGALIDYWWESQRERDR